MSGRKDTKEHIDYLLRLHNLTLEWKHIFNRWHLHLLDATGCEVWRRHGMNLKAYRDELIEFLENYNGQRPTTD